MCTYFTMFNLSFDGPDLVEPYRSPRFIASDATHWPAEVSVVLQELEASDKLDLELFRGWSKLAKDMRKALRALPIVCIEAVLRDFRDRHGPGRRPFDAIRTIKRNAAIYQRWVEDRDTDVASAPEEDGQAQEHGDDSSDCECIDDPVPQGYTMGWYGIVPCQE